ncbi:MAG: hypothetical protein WC966_00100 [Bradymonadales bacterium]
MQVKQLCVTVLLLATVFMVILAPNRASAQDACYGLESNSEWIALYVKFTESFEQEDYVEALTQAFQMQMICERAPLLNYILAKTYQKIEDQENALVHFRKATDYLSEFSAEPTLAQLYWKSRLEAELEAIPTPEESAIDEEDQVIQTELDQQLQTLASQSAEYELLVKDEISYHSTIMWTGVGLGIAGIVFTGVGIGVAKMPITFRMSDFLDCDNDGICRFQEKAKTNRVIFENLQQNRAGYALIGVGTGLLITGTVMAVFGGYQRYKLKANTDKTLSWSIGAGGANLHIVF